MTEHRSAQVIAQQGRRARDRAKNRAVTRSGTTRISDLDWYPEIETLSDDGWTNGEIAQALNLGARRIQQIKAAGRMNWSGQYQLPELKKDLAPEHKAMLDFTADGFKLFFEEFSGMELSRLGYEIIEAFIGHRNLMVNVPPRHAKSTIVSVWLVIWLLTIDRNNQVILVSKTNGLAVIHCRTVQFELEYNHNLISTFGRYAPERIGDTPWKPSRGELLILGRTREAKSGQLSLCARGAGQQILGSEATVVILDDATDRQTSENPEKAKRHLEWIQEEVLSRLETKGTTEAAGRAVVVGQRVHLNDMYGSLEKQEGLRGARKGKKLWHVVKYPAIIRWPEEDPEHPSPVVLWPERWTYDELMESYDRMGHNAFERMYQQNPLPEGSAFVRMEWFERCRDYDRVAFTGVKTDGPDFFPIARVASIDPSPTKQNAMVVADVMSLRDTFAVAIMEVKVWEGGSREMIAEMDRAIKQYDLDYIIMESSTMTKWFEGEPAYETMKRRVQFLEHHTGKNKGDAELGVESLSADWEAGRLRFCYGDPVARTMTTIIEQQALVYGHGQPDDTLMALWFIKWNWRKLRPRNRMPTRFARTGKGWSYMNRDRKIDTDKIVKEWRRKNARA